MASKVFVILVLVVLTTFTDQSDAYCGRYMNACSPPPEGRLSLKNPKPCYYPDEEVEYICDGHFSGPSTNVCGDDGEWRRPLSTCIGPCGPPGTDISVQATPIKSVFDVGEKVTFSCGNYDSVLEGPHEATCEGEGRWNPSTHPKCLQRCHDPRIPNSSNKYTITVKEDDIVKVTCETGYIIQSGENSRITCGKGGLWSALPRCVSDISGKEPSARI